MPPKADQPMIQMNIRVPAFLLGQMHSAAKWADLLPSQWVRQAIREKLERDHDQMVGQDRQG